MARTTSPSNLSLYRTWFKKCNSSFYLNNLEIMLWWPLLYSTTWFDLIKHRSLSIDIVAQCNLMKNFNKSCFVQRVCYEVQCVNRYNLVPWTRTWMLSPSSCVMESSKVSFMGHLKCLYCSCEKNIFSLLIVTLIIWNIQNTWDLI